MRLFTAALLAAGVTLAACTDPQQRTPTAPTARLDAGGEPSPVPFHSEIVWQKQFVVAIPEGRCTGVLPPGMSYLYFARLTGTGHSTHLGRTTFEGTHCVFGRLTNPTAPPPANGIAGGWNEERLELTAANGDLLLVNATLVGPSGQPGTVDFHYIETGAFVDGGTGRFRHAEGELTALIYPLTKLVVFDGSIRYGR